MYIATLIHPGFAYLVRYAPRRSQLRASPRDPSCCRRLGDDDLPGGASHVHRERLIKHSERIEGNVAIIWQETETTGTAKGKPVHSLGTETAVLEKKGDQWLITHVHWSSRKAK